MRTNDDYLVEFWRYFGREDIKGNAFSSQSKLDMATSNINSSKNNENLLKAVQDRNIEEVKECLKSKCSLTYTDWVISDRFRCDLFSITKSILFIKFS